MKRALALILLAVLSLSMIAAAPPPPPQPNITIQILTPPPAHLAVGQSFTFDVLITSDQPFNLAMVHGDQQFPGKGIYYHGSDSANHATSALLHLTMTGKGSTAGLPGGVAPYAVVAGARFHGGITLMQVFNFTVAVP